MTKSGRLVSVAELRQHKSVPNDIWIVVDEVVWNIGEFAPSHPGGESSECPQPLEYTPIQSSC
jgi:cytochrome b involved in lipid metabolism